MTPEEILKRYKDTLTAYHRGGKINQEQYDVFNNVLDSIALDLRKSYVGMMLMYLGQVATYVGRMTHMIDNIAGED